MKRVISMIAFVALAACGGSEPELSESETSQALGSLSAASSTGLSAAIEVSTETGEASITATGSCVQGGTVEATGSVQLEAESSNFTLDLTYNACAMGQLTMDGVLSYTGSTSDTGSTFSMSGEVSFSGQLEGTCSIDVDMTMDAQAGTFSIEGSACGNRMSGQYGFGS